MRVLAWPEFFSICQKSRRRPIGNEGGVYQPQCAILAVQLCPYNLGRRGSPTLGRAVGPLGPKGSGPEADP